ncbi:MAG: hypothetical protein BGO43_03095 [Gammaproteobacteria bacterium 39-13]|nr:hypothetical protein [Gammaproteobacteria bacterium]OJV86989.1 MAG: hypothetical protein BGO43_03095 [Gammaproteobacteria bacterium 39-13]
MCPIDGIDVDLSKEEEQELLDSLCVLLKKEVQLQSEKENINPENHQEFEPQAHLNKQILPLNKIKELQEKANQTAATLLDSPLAARGEFKLVVPLEEQYAVAIMYHSKATREEDKKALENECAYLGALSKLGMPCIRTYGDVFEFGKEKYAAVIMNWQPHVLMIEGKHPDAIKTLLPAMLFNVQIPKGEGWVMQLENIRQKIDMNIQNGVVTFVSVQDKISKLMRNFSTFIEKLEAACIKIADLQILIDESQQLFIIDPLAVFNVQGTNIVRYTDVLDQSQKAFVIDEALSQGLANTTKMLRAIQTWLANASKTRNLAEMKDLFLSGEQSEEKIERSISGKMSPLLKKFLKPKIDFKMLERNFTPMPSVSVSGEITTKITVLENAEIISHDSDKALEKGEELEKIEKTSSRKLKN